MWPTLNTPLTNACQALFRHKAKALALFVAVLGAAVAFTILGPRSYRSEAKLLVRLGRENVTLDPTATLGQSPVVAIPSSREGDINSVIEMLRSRALLEEVVDKVGPQVVLGKADEDRDRATVVLNKKVTVEAVKRSNVIRIAYDGPSPEACQQVVAVLVDLYLDKHVQFNRTPGAHKFLTAQAEQMRGRLRADEEKLRDLKTETGLISPEPQRQALVTRIARLEDELQQANSTLAASEAEVLALKKKVAALPAEQTSVTRGLPNLAADSMRGQLYTLQLKETELLASRPERHPEVVRVRQQIARAKAVLAREEKAREQITTAPNRLREEAQLSLIRQEPVLASLRARAGSLRTELAGERQRLDQFSRDQLRVARLQREVDLQDAHYRKYADGLHQAQIDHALEAQRISNINVVQPATYDVRPVRPSLAVNLGLGLMAAALSSVGLALVLGSLDLSLHSPKDIE
jgi:uncharacterized protein involved in exopolysaccharide biosynthesis